MNISTALFDALPIPSDQKLFLIDVGARWGTNPPWNQLDQKYINYLGFEPDEAECASLIEKYKTSSVDYIPIGLSDSVTDHILYLTLCTSMKKKKQKIVMVFFWIAQNLVT